MTEVIFLDVDGVLNWQGTTDRLGGYVGLCNERIERLNRILAARPNAKVVISSTWRKGMWGVYESMDYKPQDLPNLLKSRGFKGEVIGHTRIGSRYELRGDEIREWVEMWERAHPGEQLNFVILDDDDSAMSSLRGRDLTKHHVKTYWEGTSYISSEGVDVEGGLQDSDVQRAIEILSKGDSNGADTSSDSRFID